MHPSLKEGIIMKKLLAVFLFIHSQVIFSQVTTDPATVVGLSCSDLRGGYDGPNYHAAFENALFKAKSICISRPGYNIKSFSVIQQIPSDHCPVHYWGAKVEASYTCKWSNEF